MKNTKAIAILFAFLAAVAYAISIMTHKFQFSEETEETC